MAQQHKNHKIDLSGKRALITGGGVNIGAGIAAVLAAAGAEVLLLYRKSAAEAEKTAEAIRARGGAVRLFQGDITQEDTVSALFRDLQAEGLIPDMVINNAGIFSVAPQTELPASEWDRIFSVNVRGLFLCCREAARIMPQNSSIINIASINSFHPGFGNTAHYDASKGAVAAYTRSLAAELAPRGIRVNAVAPGLVDSPGLRAANGELAAAVADRTPLKRLTLPEDVGNAVLFLGSEMAAQITGIALVVDGGYLLT